MISYCTEKTTEFSLIPAFSSLLNELGENTPIQYWKTREGNNTSCALHNSELVYLVAFFARRPKVKVNNEGFFQGKINPYIFEFNNIAKKFRIPVFCGMPLAHNLFSMYHSEKIWFHVPPNAPEYNEVIFNLTSCSDVEINDPYSVVEQVRDENVAQVIRQQCSPMSWNQAIDIMFELNRKPGNGPWFTRSWQYKPIYFIIKHKL
ncbi:hypothetical protein C9J22_13280 [Photobacterium phosphoreum]|uniref:hypothetical protein n=1 Tax=Photobacterium phosphoreum TaxID=659 RepID=UPI000D17BFD7|nr:hypothetical protein [Photobacterium phosphoreum]PSU69845.1 hypothetical protein C9J22_13280 [Photobacterium phosphoreum]